MSIEKYTYPGGIPGGSIPSLLVGIIWSLPGGGNFGFPCWMQFRVSQWGKSGVSLESRCQYVWEEDWGQSPMREDVSWQQSWEWLEFIAGGAQSRVTRGQGECLGLLSWDWK